MVLGGAGFIGTNFIYYLGPSNDVSVVDKLTYAGRLENIIQEMNRNKWRFYHEDICNKEGMETIIAEEKPDVLVNFAAETHVSRSIIGPEEFTKTNVLGVHTVMEVLRKLSPKTFVIHISTDEVFGQLNEWDAPWRDYSPLNPRSPYAASKASGELIARSYFTTYGMDVAILRPSNCFGGYQYPEKLIPRAVTNLLEKKAVPMMGEGSQMRDWLYVTDLCDAISKIIQRRPSGECFNIPGNNIHRNRDLIAKILDIMGLEWNRNIRKIPHRLAHDFKYHVEGEGIGKFFKPSDSGFETHLRWTINFYKNNINWWKSVKEDAEKGNSGADGNQS